MAKDPFGNDRPQPPEAPGARILKRVGLGEIAVGLVLLIAGFATGTLILALVGGVLAASSGTLFVFARSLGRRG